MKKAQFDGWVSVFEGGTDYESDMARDRLDDAGINAVLMTKKDSAFKLTVGAMSRVYVLVAPADEEQARALLQDYQFTFDELTEAALAADPEHVSAPRKDEKNGGEAE